MPYQANVCLLVYKCINGMRKWNDLCEIIFLMKNINIQLDEDYLAVTTSGNEIYCLS